MNLLSYEKIKAEGLEFTGDVCFSGKYGQQVYDKEIENGGKPINTILYELYPNGGLQYYAYYRDGIPNGERVRFYEDGKVKSYCVMDMGTIDGESKEWYENGVLKINEYCKYGLVLWSKEFDLNGKIIKEKTELNAFEKNLYDKYVKAYEKK